MSKIEICGNIIKEGKEEITVPRFSSKWMELQDFSDTAYLDNHYTFALVVDGKIISSGSTLFTAPKHYHFTDPQLSYERNENQIVVTSKAYAKNVEIECEDTDIVLSDNYFDMEAGSKVIDIIKGDPRKLTLRSVYDIR